MNQSPGNFSPSISAAAKTRAVRKPRVYISYSTHTTGASARISDFATKLRHAGIDARIDIFYHNSLHGFVAPPPRAGHDAWTLWQEEQIQKADRVLIVCDEKYAQAPAVSGVARDLEFMQADLDFGAKDLGKFIPVGFGTYAAICPFVPTFIKGANYYDLSQAATFEALVRRFQTEYRDSPEVMTAKDSNPSIIWLHLSDLHNCKKRTGWDAHRVLKPLILDLKKMEEDHGLVPNLLFFTGDAAFGNVEGSRLKEQFDGAAELIKDVQMAFSTPVSLENIFIVPGNHDVDREQVTPDQQDWLKTASLDSVNDLIRKGERQWDRYMERLTAYRDFLDRYKYNHLLSEPDRLIYSAVRELHGIKVGIAGFNSAWTCSGDGEKGNLWFGGNWQSGELVDKLNEADFCIALIHHPFGWFVEWEDTDLKILFARDFAFHLHGHEHQGWVDAKADGHVRIAGGACYDKSELENGYNFVRLNLNTGEGEVWLRRYDAQGGGWVPRVVARKTNNDGLWRLGKLPCLQPLIGAEERTKRIQTEVLGSSTEVPGMKDSVSAQTTPPGESLPAQAPPAVQDPNLLRKLRGVFGTQYDALGKILESNRPLREELVRRFKLTEAPREQVTAALMLHIHTHFLRAIGEFIDLYRDTRDRTELVELVGSVLFLAMCPDYASALKESDAPDRIAIAETARQGIAEILICWTHGKKRVQITSLSPEKSFGVWETTPQMGLSEIKRALMSKFPIDPNAPDSDQQLNSRLRAKKYQKTPVHLVPTETDECLITQLLARGSPLRNLLLLIKTKGLTINRRSEETDYEMGVEDLLDDLRNLFNES